MLLSFQKLLSFHTAILVLFRRFSITSFARSQQIVLLENVVILFEILLQINNLIFRTFVVICLFWKTLVPGAGVEPAQPYGRGILSPLRLPISPPGPMAILSLYLSAKTHLLITLFWGVTNNIAIKTETSDAHTQPE